MAGLAEWSIKCRPSPFWHKILVLCFVGKRVPEVTHRVNWGKCGGGWYLGRQLGVKLCDSRGFPQWGNARPISDNFAVTPKLGWVFRFGAFILSTCMVEVENDALFSIAAV